MRHCHFSILCNELPLLKQKMGFLYRNFHQLIFYDLCIHADPAQHSYDGSFEFLNSYPDPENKITIIDRISLVDVEANNGESLVGKQKMFRIGSSYVDDSIDVFWCSDMDEFCDEAFIDDVEHILATESNTMGVDMRHLVFWRNKNLVFGISGQPKTGMAFPARVVRHIPGTVYPHCALNELGHIHVLNPSYRKWFHFAWVGAARVSAKRYHQGACDEQFNAWYKDIWGSFDVRKANLDELIGVSKVHPGIPSLGLLKYAGDFPAYINIKQLWRDLKKAKMNDK